MSDVSHVEDRAKNGDGDLVWTMWCGEQCIVLEDATVIPDDFDFYLEEHASKATCRPCREGFTGGGGLRAAAGLPVRKAVLA